MNDKYYISTGAKNCFYTLRYAFDETCYGHPDAQGNRDSFVVTRDYHIQNLSTDPVEAVRRANELKPGLNFAADFSVDKISRRAEIDWSVFQSGKYAGLSVHEVAAKDEGYLIWACENLGSSSSYAKTIELAKALVSRQLADRQLAREAAAIEAEAIAASRAARQSAVAEVIANCSKHDDDFCASIASALRRGDQLTGRALTITVEIFSKAHGRRGSKAYNAAEEVAYAALSEESAAS